MNYLNLWFNMKLANIVIEALSVLFMLSMAKWLYGHANGDVVALVLAKGTILNLLVYLLTVLVYTSYSVNSLEVDCKRPEDRTDNDKQVQYFHGRVALVKSVCGYTALLAIIITAGFVL